LLKAPPFLDISIMNLDITKVAENLAGGPSAQRGVLPIQIAYFERGKKSPARLGRVMADNTHVEVLRAVAKATAPDGPGLK